MHLREGVLAVSEERMGNLTKHALCPVDLDVQSLLRLQTLQTSGVVTNTQREAAYLWSCSIS